MNWEDVLRQELLECRASPAGEKADGGDAHDSDGSRFGRGDGGDRSIDREVREINAVAVCRPNHIEPKLDRRGNVLILAQAREVQRPVAERGGIGSAGFEAGVVTA